MSLVGLRRKVSRRPRAGLEAGSVCDLDFATSLACHLRGLFSRSDSTGRDLDSLHCQSGDHWHCVSIDHSDFDLDYMPHNCKCNIADLSYCGSDISPGNAAGGLETADFDMSSHWCRGYDTNTLSLDTADQDEDLNGTGTMLFRYWAMKCSRTPEGVEDLP